MDVVVYRQFYRVLIQIYRILIEYRRFLRCLIFHLYFQMCLHNKRYIVYLSPQDFQFLCNPHTQVSSWGQWRHAVFFAFLHRFSHLPRCNQWAVVSSTLVCLSVTFENYNRQRDRVIPTSFNCGMKQ